MDREIGGWGLRMRWDLLEALSTWLVLAGAQILVCVLECDLEKGVSIIHRALAEEQLAGREYFPVTVFEIELTKLTSKNHSLLTEEDVDGRAIVLACSLSLCLKMTQVRERVHDE